MGVPSASVAPAGMSAATDGRGASASMSTSDRNGMSLSLAAAFPASSIFTASRWTSYCRFASMDDWKIVNRRMESAISAMRL